VSSLFRMLFRVFVFVLWLFHVLSVVFVVDTNAVDYLERLVSEMI